jgi:hypothetical protein
MIQIYPPIHLQWRYALLERSRQRIILIAINERGMVFCRRVRTSSLCKGEFFDARAPHQPGQSIVSFVTARLVINPVCLIVLPAELLLDGPWPRAARSETLPDVPTVGEYVPGYEASAWYGVGAPKGTPAEIIGKLNNEINAALAGPVTRARLADLGAGVFPSSPAEFGKVHRRRNRKMGEGSQALWSEAGLTPKIGGVRGAKR